MDHFFEYDPLEDYAQWLDNQALVLSPSAFTKYTPQLSKYFVGESHNNGDYNSKTRNINKRMIEFLKKSCSSVHKTLVTVKERGYKHMMNERMRREKQKQNYLALHKLLPLGTKGDKNSIMKMATIEIQELQKLKEDLRGRNCELEMLLAANASRDNNNVEKAKVKVKVANPSCGVDSFLEVLKCLKSTGSNLTLLHSSFSIQEFSAYLEIETKIGVEKVEKAVNRALWEVDKKLHTNYSELSRLYNEDVAQLN